MPREPFNRLESIDSNNSTRKVSKEFQALIIVLAYTTTKQENREEAQDQGLAVPTDLDLAAQLTNVRKPTKIGRSDRHR